MKYFITFAGGEPTYYEAGNRIIRQAINLNLFDKTILYTDKDLKNDTIFWEQHSNFIENNPRGYGYWIWKSFVIKKTMDELIDGDILLYLDCGCELDINRKDILCNFIELVKHELLIGSYVDDCYYEKQWSKMDLILKLEMLNDDVLNSRQRQGGTNLFFVCDNTRELVNQWYEICCDYHNIDDTQSIHTNDASFIEHRHDQSVFSLLTKKYKIFNKYTLLDCIECERNKTGVSQIKSTIQETSNN